MRKLSVDIAEYRLGEAPDVLVAYGLGSCVAVALYDPSNRCGGLAHALLPTPPMFEAKRPATYVETAIAALVEALEQRGSSRDGLLAKLVGGSQMFEAYCDSVDSIGTRNLSKAREVLERMKIPVVAQDTGGDQGRSLEFALDSGSVSVRKVREPEPLLL